MRNRLLAIIILLVGCIPVIAQEDLMNLLDKEEEVNYITSAFKGTHIINGHSTKTKYRGELDFLIYHRFGPISTGIREFFGLDQANMRLGFEYGLYDQLNLGIGRSTYEKTYDGYVKWKFLRQKSGSTSFPVSAVWLTSVALPTNQTQMNQHIIDRMAYTHQLMISRKFNEDFTLQLMTGLVHLNTVPAPVDNNDIFYLGSVLRYKVSQSTALTGEYYYRVNPLESIETFDVLGIGVDIETGGHVFQLHITNARPTFEKGFITDTRNNFWDGDIRFGFNISRTFQLTNK